MGFRRRWGGEFKRTGRKKLLFHLFDASIFSVMKIRFLYMISSEKHSAAKNKNSSMILRAFTISYIPKALPHLPP